MYAISWLNVTSYVLAKALSLLKRTQTSLADNEVIQLFIERELVHRDRFLLSTRQRCNCTDQSVVVDETELSLHGSVCGDGRDRVVIARISLW